VISGGDVFRLKAEQISLIAETLLAIPHVKRLRFATKGLAVLPMKIIGDSDWLNALAKAAEAARRMFKEVVLHTHFNHPNEITGFTEDALNALFIRGIAVRNLSVMLRGVNDDVDTMLMLCRRLTWMNVRPYYSYMCDMVVGIEDLRFPLSKGLEIEKGVRGALSGPYTPLFVVDPPGGCGKRSVHSFELYDKESGLSIYSAPSVKARQLFLYADPLHSLSSQAATAWLEPTKAKEFILRALANIGATVEDLGTEISW
jgi:lysine 2,3-aminomutase